MSRSSSSGLSQDSSSTTSRRSTSSSNTSHTARVRVRRHVARLVTQLVVDYLAALRSSSHGSSRRSSPTIPPCKGSSSTTSPMLCVRVPGHVARLVVDYFAYAARPCVSARRVARRRLLRLRRASECLGMSRGSSRGSSSTISRTLRVRVPRHVARLVMRLIVAYSVCRDFVSRQHLLYLEYTASLCDIIFWSHRVDYSSRLN
jgi:hypothetical protein